ncbi:hypothetical protein ONZ51_g494 [Trametes cubensis]|uniref:Uncharacterized protein n=1 Tax=Trametes cubensis TaxID=1111947 RepID=A0AAD7U396_9APHY|nr:hypothetical protein ONZ51_g494 [Trametes cubensis]
MSELSTHYLEQFAACDGHKGERGSRRDERTPANASTRGRTGKGASNRELTSLQHAGLTHGAPVVAQYKSTEGSGVHRSGPIGENEAAAEVEAAAIVAEPATSFNVLFYSVHADPDAPIEPQPSHAVPPDVVRRLPDLYQGRLYECERVQAAKDTTPSTLRSRHLFCSNHYEPANGLS